jgi:hypothetical protein
MDDLWVTKTRDSGIARRNPAVAKRRSHNVPKLLTHMHWGELEEVWRLFIDVSRPWFVGSSLTARAWDCENVRKKEMEIL